MNLRLSTDLFSLVMSLLFGTAVVAVLLLIRHLLYRSGVLRGATFFYVVGSLTLGAIVVLAGMYATFSSTLTHVLEAMLFCSWGFVALALTENVLVDRWCLQHGIVVPRLVRDIGRGVAFILAVLLTLWLVFDVSLGSLVISSTVLSAVLGLALQDLLKNVVAGIALQVERPFDIGHWIEVNGQTGKVTEMSWRATRIHTVDGNQIIFPNSTLAQSQLNNFTLDSPLQAMHVQINIAQHELPSYIKQVLHAACLACSDVLPQPSPSIKVHQYADSFVVYDVKFWLHSYDRYPDKRDAVMTSIWYHLHRAGVQLPQPIRNMYMHTANGQADVRQQHVERAFDALHRNPLFNVLDEAELRSLAGRAHVRLYGRGEVLVRQGERGDSLFILLSGSVRIDVDEDPNDDLAALTVNRLGSGDCFGELALLTDAPRSATVTAESDAETLVIAQMALAPLMQTNADLPERLGAVLAERLAMNRAALNSRKRTDHADDEASQPTLVARIRRLFGVAR